MEYKRKKEFIYVALAFFTALGQLTWIQMTYNDPSFASAWSFKEWCIIGSISAVFVCTQTLIAWKAYLSDPGVADRPTLPTEPDTTNDNVNVDDSNG